jgi:WhiB family transcriptional regulator, redox-sensing transcriptional regulator
VANLSRLPGPVAEVWNWRAMGSCRRADASMFFSADRSDGPVSRRREVEAKAVCARCPVRSQCAAYALTTGERHGIWGGFTGTERRRLVALGWEDLADRRHRRVDVGRLTMRLREATRRRTE